MTAPFAAQEIAVRRSRFGWSRFFAGVLVAMVLGPLAVFVLARALAWDSAADLDAATTLWASCWLAGAPAAAVASAIASLRLRQGRRLVLANATELRLQGPGTRLHVIPRAEIESVLSLAGLHCGVEVLLANGDALELELEDDLAERALIGALGFGTFERRAVVALGGPRSPLRVGCGGILIAALVTMFSTCGLALADVPYHVVGDNIGYLMALVFMAASLLFVALLHPGRVIVGADGLVIERRFRKTFIPVAWLFEAEVSERGVVLSIDQDGAIRQLVLTSEKNGALVKRIRETIHAKDGRGLRANTLLARGGRSFSEWRAGLRKLAVGGGGYRCETAPLDLLCLAASSTELGDEQRLGAAIAVGLAADEDTKQRLRVAVEGIANEKLRVAMAGAVEGELEEEVALEALGFEEAEGKA